ncbi:MAG: helix-turn-helix transcriptional regulator [Pseudoflavonifractor sp.]|nr:helix-turn-helix transcriptional regulator [Pseudoflavonifractor sp.]
MRIKELMDDRGLLPIQVADAMNVTPGAVTKWIYGRAYPSADKLPKLADTLNCSIDALFGREPSTQGARDAS